MFDVIVIGAVSSYNDVTEIQYTILKSNTKRSYNRYNTGEQGGAFDE